MKVIIIDDDNFICASLKTILQADPEIEVIAVGTSGEEAISLYDKMKPDILLMDIRMGAMSGLDAGEKVLEKHPEARILYLTTFSDDEYIVRSLRMGAKGYLIKQNAEAIAPALKAVMSGQNVFGSEIAAKIPSIISNPGKPDLSEYGIGEREIEVIEHVAKGLSKKNRKCAIPERRYCKKLSECHTRKTQPQRQNPACRILLAGKVKYCSNVPNSHIILNENFSFKGPLNENYVLQQLIPHMKFMPNYFGQSNTLELDFLIQKDDRIIPLEVKSGKGKRAASFKRYIERYNPQTAVRFSSNGYVTDGKITNIPLYLAGRTLELI